MSDQVQPAKYLGGSGLRSSSLVFLLGAAGAVITVAGVKKIPSIGPMLLALILVIMAWPVGRFLRRVGAPTPLALVALITTVYGILTVLIGSTVWASLQLSDYLATKDYSQSLGEYEQRIRGWLASAGINQTTILDQVAKIDFAALGSRALSAVSGLMSLVTVISITIIAALFIAMDAFGFVDRLDDSTIYERPGVRSALSSFAQQTRSYFVVATVFGLIVAVFDVLALWLMGIPLALTWGVLSFITNYIPNIGFVMGMIPPMLVALLEKGVLSSLLVGVIYFVINTVIQTLIQPKFVGDSLGLSATLSFFSLLFWAYVIGPIGTLIAVPMTLLVKALLIDTDHSAHWMLPLVSLSEQDSIQNRSVTVENVGTQTNSDSQVEGQYLDDKHT